MQKKENVIGTRVSDKLMEDIFEYSDNKKIKTSKLIREALKYYLLFKYEHEKRNIPIIVISKAEYSMILGLLNEQGLQQLANVCFEKALQGEREALLVWKEFSQCLGKFLAGMVNIFNPQIIVFGGGVSGAFKLFKPLVWQVIKEQAMWPHVKDLKLAKAKLPLAGVIGAALLAKESLS